MRLEYVQNDKKTNRTIEYKDKIGEREMEGLRHKVAMQLRLGLHWSHGGYILKGLDVISRKLRGNGRTKWEDEKEKL